MPSPLINVLLDDEPVGAQMLDQITRLEVRESDEDPSVAALRLRLAQQPDGTFFPLDEEIFGPGVRLDIDIAAPGGTPQRLFSGFVTHIRPHFEAIESNCYLEVLGMDAAMLLDASERTADYPDASDSDAVTEILERYNLRAEIESTPETHRADGRLLVQRATDWRFLRQLARRNGYVCYFEYDAAAGETVGHFKRRPLDGDPQADLTILREESNLEWIDVQWVLTGPVRHTGAAIDAVRKRIVRGEGEPALDPLGEDGLSEAIEQGLKTAGAEAATALLRGARPTDQGLAAAAAGSTDCDRFVIEARGQVDPRLRRGLMQARRTILIKGIGARLSGIYYVRTVRTAIDEGRITQTFIAERNALGQTGQEEFGQSAEEEAPQ
jgi:hypothetical protein